VAVVDRVHGLRDGLGLAVAGEPRLHLVAATGTVADLAPAVRRDVDVLLVQSALPGMDLAVELRLGREALPAAVIVAVCAFVDEALVTRLTAHGASWVASAHLPMTELLALVATGTPGRAEHWSGSTSAADEAAARWGLTPREREVLVLLSDGLSPQQIARRLGRSVGTVRDHLQQARAKLGCENAVALVVTAYQRGVLPAVGRPFS
jgi:DNA-binding NarL/FixJ family response regulator